MNFVIFYTTFSIKGGTSLQVVCSGIRAIHYSVNIAVYSLNSEDCVDPWALFLQDFSHSNLMYFLLAALIFQNP